MTTHKLPDRTWDRIVWMSLTLAALGWGMYLWARFATC